MIVPVKLQIQKIVSGGQTGVDRAALDFCLEYKIPCSGWCPRGRLAEDGIIPEKYLLNETPLSDVSQRTEWNVRDSDGTLVFMYGDPKDGTVLTCELARKYLKPLLVLRLEEKVRQNVLLSWLISSEIKTLNIAGPRESYAPGVIYKLTKEYLKDLLL